MSKSKSIFGIIIIILFIGVVSCAASADSASAASNGNDSTSTLSNTDDTSDTAIEELVKGNIDFAFGLYGYLAMHNDNLFFSPYSISTALAMTYAGADDDTKAGMAEALNFTLDDEELHSAFNAIAENLEIIANKPLNYRDGQPLKLNVANSLWLEKSLEFNPDYLETVDRYYNAKLDLLNFMGDPNGSRNTINRWIEGETEGRIPELIPQGGITPDTIMTLVNAIYFLASWDDPFEEDLTEDGPFTLFSTVEVMVPMMTQTDYFGYMKGENYQVLSMPYVGRDTSMVIFLPDVGRYGRFESEMSSEFISEVMDNINPTEVKVTMPKFELRSSFELAGVLSSMGMGSAFRGGFESMLKDPAGGPVFISKVFHEAFVSVDEEGTEAAAATAVVMGLGAAPDPPEPVDFKLDRPFIFMIVEDSTNTILFLGRLHDPS